MQKLEGLHILPQTDSQVEDELILAPCNHIE